MSQTATAHIALLSSGSLPQLALDATDPDIRFDRQPWRDDAGPIGAWALVEGMLHGEPLALCIGDDVPLELAFEVSTIIDQSHSDIGVVLLRTPSPDLWQQAVRSGVRDVIDPVSLDFDLLPSLRRAITRSKRMRAVLVAAVEPSHAHGRVIAVLSPKGGSGKTMVATNLAVALAAANIGEVVLVDLDCVFGDVVSVLDLTADHTIGQLARLHTFDSTTLKLFLTRHEPSGLHVLASSGLPEEGEEVTAEMADQILELLSRDFSHVIVDTAAGLDERAFAAIERATDIILLASMDIASIRNLTKEINALDRLGLNAAQRHFILNRADTRVGIEVADVEAAIGMKVSAALPSSRLVPLSMNQGRAMVLSDADSPVSRQLLAIAARFIPAAAMVAASTPVRKSKLSLRRRSS